MEYMFLFEYLAIGSIILSVGYFGYCMVNLNSWNKETRGGK